MNKRIKINKKLIIVFIVVVILIVIISIAMGLAFRKNKINKQIMNNINSDENYTISYNSGRNISLDDDVYNKLKENNIDLIVVNDDYVVRLKNQYIEKNINLDISIKKDNKFQNCILIESNSDMFSDMNINVAKYIHDAKFVSQFNNDGTSDVFVANDIKINDNGFANVNLNEGIKKYFFAYIIPDNVSVNDITINKGAKKKIDFGLSNENYTLGSIQLESEDKEAISIDDEFNVVANKEGEYKLYIKTKNETKEIKVTVNKSVEKIELSKITLELLVNGSETVTAKIIPEDAVNKELVWTSSNENIATVNNEGTISAKSVGNCEIVVSTKEEPIVSAKLQLEVKDLPKFNEYPNATEGITYINNILLVNKAHPVPSNYAPGLLDEVYNAFLELRQAALNEGHTIDLLSGYRSYETQKRLYNNYVATYGQAEADTFSAKPGTSEHQTGLAMDVGWIDDAYADTPSGKWLASNCYKYGFIIRYPKDKESITGYKYEPWHIRYLGKEVAKSVYDSGLCLEEYLGVN